MRKIIVCLFLLTVQLSVFAQAKLPKLMVVPSDVWCIEHQYTETIDVMGEQEVIPDYKKALQSNRELMAVISKINILMADRGFPLQDLSQTLRSIQRTSQENSVIRTKTSGAALAESPLDRLRRTARADIILEVDWSVNQTGPKRSVTYNLRGLDAYSNKQVAGAQGTGAPSFSAETPVLIEEAVMNHMDNFTAQLRTHFDDLLANGREAVIELQIPDNGQELDFETEFGGKELGEIITHWMAENAVQNRFSKSDATENYLLFDQVRIPIYQENGMPMDADAFARLLRSYLKNAPYNITCKVVNRGLGRCLLIVGEK
ncbi:MAG: hypothetical protein IJS95_05470 [Prevotella sp.]|nr:hypothetical protein [Prevotella sp.]